MDRLTVSETFYSIQGEGKFTGYPAVFFRLSACNLLCGMPNDSDITTPREDCKWVCDTIKVWRQGKNKTYQDIFDSWKKEGFVEHLKNKAHLVITGGEPLIQQVQLAGFLKWIDDNDLIRNMYVEIETNGTIEPIIELRRYINCFNVSPKLSNCGNEKKLRYNEDVIKFYSKWPSAYFKFVVVDAEDVAEMFTEYIKRFEISNDKIWLMPGAYNREMLWKNGQTVAELCKKHHFKMSSRLHVEIWDRLTGV